MTPMIPRAGTVGEPLARLRALDVALELLEPYNFLDDGNPIG